MIFTISFIRISTARAVAETTEQTIALQCLASCYTNNTPSTTWNSNATFATINSKGTNTANFDPLKTFNDTMHAYNLMSDDYSVPSTQVYLKYDATTDPDHPTFEVQFGSFPVTNNWWDMHVYKVLPNPVQAVVEDN
jgi:hypothetical protein